MCGRTACTLDPTSVCQACTYPNRQGNQTQPVWRNPPGGQQYYPSHNVAPGSHTPVLLAGTHSKDTQDDACNSSQERFIQPMQWGLVPSWHKGDPKAFSYNMNNCRSDGMLDKRTFSKPLEKGQRCVVLADGYFEWATVNGKKQAYFIYFPQKCEGPFEPDLCDIKQEEGANGEWRGQRLLCMAGIFDVWKREESEETLYSYSVITVDASPAVCHIHHRMPAILETDDEVRDWLDYKSVPMMKAVELIHSSKKLTCHPVSSVVNNSRNKSPDCVKMVELGKPKESASSNMMKAWLRQGKPQQGVSELVKAEEKSQQKRTQTKDNKNQTKSKGPMEAWLMKASSPQKRDGDPNTSDAKKFKS